LRKRAANNTSNVNNSSNTSKEDVFTLSDKGKELKFIKEEVLKSKEVNSDKIGKLKQQINKGCYQVSSMDIAQKMIERSLVDELVRR